MKPAFRVVADGEDLTAQIADRLLSIRVTEHAGQQSDSLEIALDDREKKVPVPRSGAWLKVWIGYSDQGQLPVYMGSFSVDEVEVSMGPRSMVIKATAAQTAPLLVKEQRTQSWHAKSLQDIAGEIAKRNGLQLQVLPGAPNPTIKHEDQTNESDQSFLTRLAEKYKATVKPQDGKLVLSPRDTSPLKAVVIDVTETLNWRATLKNRGAYGAVKVKWMDRKSNTEKVLEIGQRGPLPIYEEKQLFRNEAEAKKAAESRLQSLKAGEVRVNLDMIGRPNIRAIGSITLTNFRQYVDGDWQVNTVTHEITNSGFSTSVDCGTKGDEDSEWSEGGGGTRSGGTGRGRNNGKPATEKARIVADAAASSRGMNTRGGPDGGNNACVYAVNKVLRKAGITPPWGNSNYVPDARAALARGAGTQLSGPEPGAIVILRDNGSPPYPHIGIVQNDGQIISNSSSRGSFSWVASPSSYANYYGRTPEYWRLK